MRGGEQHQQLKSFLKACISLLQEKNLSTTTVDIFQWPSYLRDMSKVTSPSLAGALENVAGSDYTNTQLLKLSPVIRKNASVPCRDFFGCEGKYGIIFLWQ